MNFGDWSLVGIWVVIGLVVICCVLSIVRGERQRKLTPDPQTVSLRLEREAGLVFDGARMLPGYFEYNTGDTLYGASVAWTARDSRGRTWRVNERNEVEDRLAVAATVDTLEQSLRKSVLGAYRVPPPKPVVLPSGVTYYTLSHAARAEFIWP